jgi:Zn finger protein HypA/HybF involved in hydrogenase expression
MSEFSDKQIGIFMKLLSDITKNVTGDDEASESTRKIVSFAYGIIGQITIKNNALLADRKEMEAKNVILKEAIEKMQNRPVAYYCQECCSYDCDCYYSDIIEALSTDKCEKPKCEKCGGSGEVPIPNRASDKPENKNKPCNCKKGKV